ncbi:retrovirus-related Pol polyprotein from transposon TNT 1-94 [Argentina anserina]|uniref:retrovirus-related Pol polyprotein from transposon TNT 1-94 n=1 Tax=Argentina anserina TaxID=57926 RepID=UPI00217691CA|nr:retrovirus-related Pol polyprotein from transposon TNT 1-94 [Potentilla anserina]
MAGDDDVFSPGISMTQLSLFQKRLIQMATRHGLGSMTWYSSGSPTLSVKTLLRVSPITLRLKRNSEDLQSLEEWPFCDNPTKRAPTGPEVKSSSIVCECLAAARVMAENNNYVQPSIPRFDGHYDHWSLLMENFLRSKEYWSLIETGFTEPAAGEVITAAQRKTLDELKLKDLKAKNYLFQAIDRTILDTILQKDTAKQIWDSMKKKYEGNARVKCFQLQALRKDFEILELKVGESVTDYYSRVMSVANRMRTHGQQMDDATVVDKILQSLTEKFNYIACSIEESKNIDEMSVDELQSSLLVHEQKLNRSRGEEPAALKISTNGAFPARGRGRGVWRGKGRSMRYGSGSGLKHDGQSPDFHSRGGRGGFKHEHQSSGRGRGYFDKSKVECFRCHGFGHFRDECNAKLHREKQKFGE